MNNANLEVANTILQQLGGRGFLAMTGCKNLSGDDKSLTMKLIPNRSHAKWLKITLSSMDWYKMEFMKFNTKTGKVTIVKDFDMIYDDQLRTIFTETTGLYTKLF